MLDNYILGFKLTAFIISLINKCNIELLNYSFVFSSRYLSH